MVQERIENKVTSSILESEVACPAGFSIPDWAMIDGELVTLCTNYEGEANMLSKKYCPDCQHNASKKKYSYEIMHELMRTSRMSLNLPTA